MLIISRAALLPYDGGEASCRAFAPDAEEGAYLSTLAEQILASDASRKTALQDEEDERLSRFGRAPFEEAAGALLSDMHGALRAAEVPEGDFCLGAFAFLYAEEPHLCVCRITWQSVLLQRMDLDEGGVRQARIAPSPWGMPRAGGKDTAGFVVNLTTGDIRLKDVNVVTAEGNRALFAELFFSMRETVTEKAALKAVRTALQEAAPPEMEAAEPTILRALAQAAEQGEIRVEAVAREVFADEPECEALVSAVQERVAEQAAPAVIPVESPKIVRRLQTLRLRTDTGIALSVPQQLAEDAARFSVINNPDGTISIFLGHISELRTD